jgi:hypothetical protein
MGTYTLRNALIGYLGTSLLVLGVISGQGALASQQPPPNPPRQKVALAPFALPRALDGITSVSLLDLLLKEAKDSPRYEAVLPNEHLTALLERARLNLAAGLLPPDAKKEELDARFLLLPSASRAGKTTVLTATLVDLSRSQVVNTFSIEAVGEPEATFDLVKQLWRLIDSPCTGSFRVRADGHVWDLLKSRAVVYDYRYSLFQRVQRFEPNVKKTEIMFQLVGTGLLKCELVFDQNNALLGTWDLDGNATEQLLPFETDQARAGAVVGRPTDHDIYAIISDYMDSKVNVKMSGTFYLQVWDRFGGRQRLDLTKNTWQFVRQPGTISTTLATDLVKY